MQNVFDYIKNYAKVHGIEDYKLKTNVLDKSRLNQVLTLSNNVAFFFKIFAEGEILDWNDIEKDFLTVETPTDFWNIGNIAEIVDFGNIQKAEADFIFFAENSVKFNLSEGLSTSMFSVIKNLCIQYVILIPTRYKNAAGNGTEIKIKATT